MIEMVLSNADKHFTIVYSSAILDSLGKSDLERIQEQFQAIECGNIIFIDSDSSEFQEGLQNDRERALYAIAVKELANLGGGGGNPAAASDIIRILTPCSRKGIYTDFDVPFTEETIDKIITIKSPILFPVTRSQYCNDVVAVVPGVASTLVDKIQQNILEGYSSIGLSRLAVSDKLGSPEDCSRLANLIDELKRKSLSAMPPEDLIFELRQFIELEINECQKNNNELSLNFWRSAFMESVMVISGPKNYELACSDRLSVKNNNFCATELSDLVKSQVTGQDNDASWVPAHPSEVKKASVEGGAAPSVRELEAVREAQRQFKVDVADARPSTSIASDAPDASSPRT